MNSNEQTKSSEITQTTSDMKLKEQWWPSEFRGIPLLCESGLSSATCNQEIAFAEVPGSKCPVLASGCTNLMIYARVHCSKVYIEIKLVDPYYTNLGFANGIISNMVPEEIAFLNIPWFINGVTSYHFTEVSCT